MPRNRNITIIQILCTSLKTRSHDGAQLFLAQGFEPPSQVVKVDIWPAGWRGSWHAVCRHGRQVGQLKTVSWHEGGRPGAGPSSCRAAWRAIRQVGVAGWQVEAGGRGLGVDVDASYGRHLGAGCRRSGRRLQHTTVSVHLVTHLV